VQGVKISPFVVIFGFMALTLPRSVSIYILSNELDFLLYPNKS
jgi:hypothetical protein